MADTNFNYYWRQYLKGGIGPEKGIAALAILEKRFKLGASIRLTEDELSEVEARVDALSAKYDLDTEPGEQGSEAEVVASDEDKQEADALLLLLKSKCGPMFEHMTKESWGRLEADLDTVDTLKCAKSVR